MAFASRFQIVLAEKRRIEKLCQAYCAKYWNNAAGILKMSQRKTPKLRRNKGPFVKGRNYTPVTVQLRFCETFPREYSQNRSGLRLFLRKKVIGFAHGANHRASPAPINRLPGHSFQKRVREKRRREKYPVRILKSKSDSGAKDNPLWPVPHIRAGRNCSPNTINGRKAMRIKARR